MAGRPRRQELVGRALTGACKSGGRASDFRRAPHQKKKEPRSRFGDGPSINLAAVPGAMPRSTRGVALRAAAFIALTALLARASPAPLDCCGDGSCALECTEGCAAAECAACCDPCAGVVCPAPTAQCKVAGTCSGAGLCSAETTAPDTTVCDDTATGDGLCAAGACISACAGVVCPPPTAQCKVAGTCSGAGVCADPDAAAGAACDYTPSAADGMCDGAGACEPAAPVGSWAAVSQGGSWGCGVDAAQRAWCWGTSVYGALGQGLLVGPGRRLVLYTAQTQLQLPALVVSAPLFASITAGEDHACALTPTGAAYCWGAPPLAAAAPFRRRAPLTPSLPRRRPERRRPARRRHPSQRRRPYGRLHLRHARGLGQDLRRLRPHLRDLRRRRAPAGLGLVLGCALRPLGRARRARASPRARLSPPAPSVRHGFPDPSPAGNNDGGKLGVAVATASSPVPVQTTGVAAAADVSAGDTFSCALAGAGVLCWCATPRRLLCPPHPPGPTPRPPPRLPCSQGQERLWPARLGWLRL
jgi:hypothetical protein